RIHRLRVRGFRLREATRPVGELQQHSAVDEPALYRVPGRLRPVADRVVRDPQPVRRHARLPRRDRRQLAEFAHRQLHRLGKDPQQPADPDLGRRRRPEPGTYAEPIDHYSVLRTLEDMYGLAALGNASAATPITDVWSPAALDFGIS